MTEPTPPHTDLPEGTPSPVPQTAPPARRRRVGVWTAATLAGVLLLSAALVAGVWWAVSSAAGTAWLLARLPHVTFVEPQGSLIGDFSAKQMTVLLSGTDRIVIDRPRWTGLSARYVASPLGWVAIRADQLAADRVTVQTTPSGKPFTWPTNLRLPVWVDIDAVRLGELVLPGTPERPGQTLHGLQGRVQLGADGGTKHRIDQLSLRLDPMTVRGWAAVDADAPMAIDIDLQATQSPSAEPPNPPAWARALRADWQARVQAQGPLARFRAEARLRAQGQQLDAEGVVAATEAWPLPQLEATTENLDLSAFFTQAPATQLSGSVSIVPVDPPAGVAPNTAATLGARGTLTNAQPGRWDEQRLPLRRLTLDVRGRPGQPARFDLASLALQLGVGARDAGQIKAEGFWDAGQFELRAQLVQLQPGTADLRLPAMTLSGPVTLSGTATEGQSLPTDFKALADLNGRLESPARAVQLRLDASGNRSRIDLKEFHASADRARASVSGHAERREAAWQVEGNAALVEFDPQPWFPGLPGTAWQRGPHRLNGKGDWSLTLPDAPPASAATSPLDRLAQWHGRAQAQVADSLLAGVSLSATLNLAHAAGQPLRLDASVDAGGNQVQVAGSVTPADAGANDRWTGRVQAREIGRLAPVLALVPGLETSGLLEGLTGTLDADAQLAGRWPRMTTGGQAKVPLLRAGPLHVSQGQVKWQAGTARDAPLDVLADVNVLRWRGQQLDATRLQVQGTPAAHTLSAQTEARAAPPAWVNALQGTSGMIDTGDAHTRARATARGGLSGGPFAIARARADAMPEPLGWQGTLTLLELKGNQEKALPWFLTRDVAFDLRGGEQAHVGVGSGRAQMLDAAMRWDRIDWLAGSGPRTQQLDVQAELEPLAVAPLLQRLQPDFGWSGDLQMTGRIVMRQTENFNADIVFERASGDLKVTDDAGTQPLGLTDLRLGLNAQDGVWSFTQGLAGKQLGVAAGAVVVRTSPQSAWPEASAPLQGVLEAQVANLGTWGPWVPPGWRLGGRLGVTASLGGTFGAPEYTGEMRGSGISVRNLLQGVDVTDGELGITLEGETARIRTFTAKAGDGRVDLSGDATFGGNPRAQLSLLADKFQVLGRVDRRVVASGDARLTLDRDTLQLNGKLRVDEGLFDFTRGDAPSLGDDVVVTGRTSSETEPLAPAATARTRSSQVDLQVDLGEHLRIKGRGLDAGLKGDIRLTTPNGRLALNGSVRVEDGNYAAYGQKLTIDRGIVTFTGPPEDPRLDIEATRPNLDERVGVQIGGTAQNPRVRLYSQTDMTDTDRLSWLLLGRASEGLGTNDTALLQRAALALLAGEGEGVTDQLTKAIGIDEISLRQTDGEVRETVVTLGKQLSRRWYVGYERSLEATTGNWQLIYRIAQRFTLRAQSGLDNSLDLIWTWRWE